MRWLKATQVLLALFCLVTPTFLSAQSTGGRILGRITDPTGALLANVKVELVNQDTAVSREAISYSHGVYNFVEVPVGTYRLEFDLSGFKKNIRKDVLLQVNQVVTINMTMQVGEAKEVV